MGNKKFNPFDGHLDYDDSSAVSAQAASAIDVVSGVAASALSVATASKQAWVDTDRFGWIDRTDSTLSFDDSTYVFTLTDAGSGWSYYRNGLKFTISGNKTTTLSGSPPTAGVYYIYIDANDGTLTNSTDEWDLIDDKVPVAMVMWDSTSTPKYWIADERHGFGLDKKMHYYLHAVEGAKVVSSPTLAGYTLNSDVDTNKTFSISESTLLDQDYLHTLSTLADPDGTSTDYVVWYRTSASTWSWKASAMPFSYTGAQYIDYDNAGTITEGQQSKYYTSYLLMTNITGAARFIIVPGRAEFGSVAEARAEDVGSFTWNGFEIAEAVICYRLVWETSNSYTSKGKCRLATEPEAVNITATTTVSSGAAIDHNTLANLQGGTTDEFFHLTSDQASVLSTLPNAISVVSNALSVEIADRVSADNALSNAISALSDTVAAGGVTTDYLSNADSVVSAQAASAINVVSNALSVAEKALSDRIDGVSTLAADAATSNELSVVSAAVDVVSAQVVSVSAVLDAKISTISADYLSADAALSNKISVASAAATSADAHANTVSAAVVTLSGVLSDRASVLSAAAADALSVANVASNAASVVSNALSNEISNRISADNALSNAISALSDAVAAGGATTDYVSAQDQSVLDYASNLVSVLSDVVAGIPSADVVSAQLVSVSAVLDAKISTISADYLSADAALSNKISVASAAATSAVNIANEAATSAELATEIGDRQSADNALSNVISAIEVRVSTISADYLSADAALSNKISVASAAATSADGHANTVSAAVVTLSGVLSERASVLSAAAADALSVANAASVVAAEAATSAELAALSAIVASAVTSNALSVVSTLAAEAATSGELAATSAALDGKISTISADYLSADAALSNKITVVSALAAEAATSAELATTSAAVQSAAYKKTYTWLVSAPATGGMYGTQIPATVKATKVIAATVSASTTIDVNVERRPTYGSTGSNVLSADITGSATPVSAAADTSTGAATITAGSWIYLDISGTSGTPAIGIVVLEVEKP